MNRPFYVPIPHHEDDYCMDNPHTCINDADPCLTCALILVMGEEHRTEAIEIGIKLLTLDPHTLATFGDPV